jgi:eukaryotic-like serine/threonine-protein kinase
MPLTPGTRLGPYEILAPIGAGGMGEVYRAHDTRLGRDVALKILPEEIANDPARRQRFEQEARAVAALSHPNIVTLYDVGDGYIITELVDGEPLRRAKPNLRKALDIAVQTASGLAAAHEAGIVHRDLKPGNILLTRDGRPKILDFGLAKVAPARAAAASETVTARTEPGTVMGTVGYMSPEQVRGADVDQRSDIFNLGLILHEFLSGQRTFQGDTSVEVMAAILKQDAPDLPEAVPAGVRQIVARCLEKDPANRFQSAKDLAFALSQSTSQTGTAPVVSVRRGRRARSRWVLALLASAGLGLASGFFFWRTPESQSWTGTLVGGPEVAWNPRLSPDGHTLAMLTLAAGQSQVAVMRLEAGDWAVLTHDPDRGGPESLTWSPDGSRIYYDRVTDVPKGIYSVPVLGGESRLVLDNAGYPEALPDGSLLLTRFNSLGDRMVCRFWPESGKLQEFPFKVLSSRQRFRGFPGAREAAVFGSPTPTPAGQSGSHLYVLDLASGHARRLPVESGFAAGTMAVARDGRSVLFPSSRAGIWSISAEGRSPARNLFSITGTPTGMDTGPDGSVFVDQQDRPNELVFLRGGHAQRVVASAAGPSSVTVLPDGRAVWEQVIAGRRRLVVIQPGKEPVPLVITSDETSTPATVAGPGLVAFMVGPPGKAEIGIGSLETGRIVRRIPFDKPYISTMSSSPDGKTFYCAADHVVWAVPSAGGTPVRIHEGDRAAVDPDGNYLAVLTQEPANRLYKVPLHGGAPQEIHVSGDLRPELSVGPQAISRDGRLLALLVAAGSWFDNPGIIDLATGRATLIPTDYPADYRSLNWTADGQVMGIALPMRSSIWKFAPQGR